MKHQPDGGTLTLDDRWLLRAYTLGVAIGFVGCVAILVWFCAHPLSLLP